MFTYQEICQSIEEFLGQPMTPEHVHVLADLLYIKEHCHELHVGEEPDKARLCEWVDHMENADGTTGGHWSRHEAEVIQAKYGIPCGELEFYVALNMMYSDYCAAVNAEGAGTVALYARMAEAFLKGPDAQPGKLERYYQYIARHE